VVAELVVAELVVALPSRCSLVVTPVAASLVVAEQWSPSS
jgi:hypothetical protein